MYLNVRIDKVMNVINYRKTISASGILNAQVLFLGGQPQLRSVRQASENIVPKVDLTGATAPAAITSTLSNVNFKGIIQDVQVSIYIYLRSFAIIIFKILWGIVFFLCLHELAIRTYR